MEILNRKDLLLMPEKKEVVGCVLIQSYATAPQKNGGQYISGHLQALGDIPFKVWSDNSPTSLYAKMVESQEYTGKVMKITAKTDFFGGFLSLVISDGVIVSESEGISASDLMENIYDAAKYMQTLRATLQKQCSDKAVMVFELIMSKIEDKFVKEFGAIYHHDNCKSGLLAHTTKLTRLATMIKLYPSLLSRVSPDVLFIGCALHDIGKVMEYSNGSISEEGKLLSHMILGPVFLSRHEDEISKLMGRDYYLELLAILGSHSGEFGERPRTVAAYVIHLLDMLEAKLASINSLCADTDGQIKWEGYTLN